MPTAQIPGMEIPLGMMSAAAEDVTRGVGEGVEDVGRAVNDVVSGGDNETQNPQENGATTQNGAGMAQ